MPRGWGSADKAWESAKFLTFREGIQSILRQFFNVFKTLIDIEDMFSRHIPGAGGGADKAGESVKIFDL